MQTVAEMSVSAVPLNLAPLRANRFSNRADESSESRPGTLEAVLDRMVRSGDFRYGKRDRLAFRTPLDLLKVRRAQFHATDSRNLPCRVAPTSIRSC